VRCYFNRNGGQAKGIVVGDNTNNGGNKDWGTALPCLRYQLPLLVLSPTTENSDRRRINPATGYLIPDTKVICKISSV
jgi:hypothetical protein